MKERNELFESLHRVFGEYLKEASRQDLDPRETVAQLIEFCATECANGHAQITYKLKLTDEEIQKALRVFGNAFTNTFHKRLLEIEGILN